MDFYYTNNWLCEHNQYICPSSYNEILFMLNIYVTYYFHSEQTKVQVFKMCIIKKITGKKYEPNLIGQNYKIIKLIKN